jgi:hypothetical protein
MLPRPTEIRRVIVVVLDGLRPDAIERFGCTHIQRLSRMSAWTPRASSVSPSVTAAALTSLFTGVSPEVHGIDSEDFRLPRAPQRLSPLTRVLADAGVPCATFIRKLPLLYRGLARQMARYAGVSNAHFAGDSAAELLLAARATLEEQHEGFIFLHWPDADTAGHVHGWMSEPYRQGCLALDTALGALAAAADIANDPGTLLVALADHGGGGAVANDHDSEHRLDRTIPLIMRGPLVARVELLAPRLVDVPATVLWALGIDVPSSYEGRVLHEAFAAASEMTAVV